MRVSNSVPISFERAKRNRQVKILRQIGNDIAALKKALVKVREELVAYPQYERQTRHWLEDETAKMYDGQLDGIIQSFTDTSPGNGTAIVALKDLKFYIDGMHRNSPPLTTMKRIESMLSAIEKFEDQLTAELHPLPPAA